MYGTLYLIPCPISDETAPWDVLPAANRAVMDSLDYFIVENTRTARRFLSKAGAARPIDTLCFRELNEHTVAGREVEELVKPLVEVLQRIQPVLQPCALLLHACVQPQPEPACTWTDGYIAALAAWRCKHTHTARIQGRR